jgi:hypothetical protein
MSELFVQLKIPIPTEPLVSAPALTFASWLPIGDNQALHVEQEDITLKLWFDITSTWWASQHKEEDLPHIDNVLAHRIFADAIVQVVSDQLVQYMVQRDFTRRPTKEEEALQQEYDAIAERLLVLLLGTLNRLLLYVRSRKGQYWLSEYPIDLGRMSGYYVKFEARARVDDGPWFRFGPSSVDHRSVELVSNERYVRADEWEEIRSFVGGISRRPPLIGTLLAGAEALGASGNRRAALTEAVTALEVALYAFAGNPNADSAFGAILAKRLDIVSLRNQVKRFGLRGSFRYLLPVILSESVLPRQVLEACNRAIDERNTIVHNTQKLDVRPELLKTSLRAIRRMCEIFESLTLPTE